MAQAHFLNSNSLTINELPNQPHNKTNKLVATEVLT
jgi:hypothetical protein